MLTLRSGRRADPPTLPPPTPRSVTPAYTWRVGHSVTECVSVRLHRASHRNTFRERAMVFAGDQLCLAMIPCSGSRPHGPRSPEAHLPLGDQGSERGAHLFLSLFPTGIVHLCSCFNEIIFMYTTCKKQNHSAYCPRLKGARTGWQS